MALLSSQAGTSGTILSRFFMCGFSTGLSFNR
uniref:Uncharacterized protein n=1 Tax=Anguilla anguilla TaxID=7936 RepID=A0A0E9ULN8_ANGAN